MITVAERSLEGRKEREWAEQEGRGAEERLQERPVHV